MRSVLVVAHTSREQIITLVNRTAEQFRAAGFEVRMLASEAAECTGPTSVVAEDSGGDGTLLRAAELARPAGVPMLGVNLGHVGFLAESEPRNLSSSIAALADGTFTVEERATVEADVLVDGAVVARAWALNEASLERTNRERMLEIALAVDDRPFLRFGCDGVLCATATGSTAYAFSAGGPIIWPDVEAMLVVPNAAHALFARPFVVSPSSTVDIDLIGRRHAAVLSCDGRRSIDVPAGARVRLTRGELPVRVVRLGDVGFTDRLVSKFQLPVRSLREASPPPEASD